MTIRADDRIIILDGICQVEDAEPLLALLQEDGTRPVDLSLCSRAHTAVIQVLIATGARISGPRPSGFLGDWIVPNLSPDKAGQPSIGSTANIL